MNVERRASTSLHRRPAIVGDQQDRWLHDCWLVEVMPPTWAWAYRRLLNVENPLQKYGGGRLA